MTRPGRPDTRRTEMPMALFRLIIRRGCRLWFKAVVLQAERGGRATINDIHLALFFVNLYDFQDALLLPIDQIVISRFILFVFWKGGKKGVCGVPDFQESR